MSETTEAGSPTTHDRILIAAAELLAEGGSEAVSTRAVSARAGVQAPTLYRLFGDKQGMLEALASYGFDRHLADKEVALAGTGDAIDDLRRGWDVHVDFGRAQPALYELMYGTVFPGRRAAAAKEAYQRLLAVTERAAAAGALRVPADIAARMIHSSVVGVTLTLIATPDDLDGFDGFDLSARVRDAILASVAVVGRGRRAESSATDVLAARALALDGVLNEHLKNHPGVLSEGEAALLKEWLRRLATVDRVGAAS